MLSLPPGPPMSDRFVRDYQQDQYNQAVQEIRTNWAGFGFVAMVGYKLLRRGRQQERVALCRCP